MKIIGIYKIECFINNKVYIGQSCDVNARLKRHKTDLINGKHRNRYLQFAVNKYGIENFSFDIICECKEEELDELEKYYIRLYGGNESENTYNIESGGNLNKHLSIEQRKKLSIRNIGNKYNLGRKLSEEQKQKISLANKGRKHTEEWKRHNSEILKSLHLHRSEEAKRKISQSQIGELNHMYGRKFNDKEKETYKGQLQAKLKEIANFEDEVNKISSNHKK